VNRRVAAHELLVCPELLGLRPHLKTTCLENCLVRPRRQVQAGLEAYRKTYSIDWETMLVRNVGL
jgi:hypothetical protein